MEADERIGRRRNIFALLEQDVDDVERFPNKEKPRSAPLRRKPPTIDKIDFKEDAANLLLLDRYMLREIFQHLTGKDIFRLSPVCKQLRQSVKEYVASDPKIWQKWLTIDFHHRYGKRGKHKLKQRGIGYMKELYINLHIHERGYKFNNSKYTEYRDIRGEALFAAFCRYVLKSFQNGEDIDRHILTCSHVVESKHEAYRNYRIYCEICQFKCYMTQHNYYLIWATITKYQLKEPSESLISDLIRWFHLQPVHIPNKSIC